MASYTPNVNLYLPSRNDADVDVDTSLADNFNKIDSSLAQSPSQPVLTGEVGVVNKKYPYGNVKRYGAKGDSNEANDDTVAFQNAIDNAFLFGFNVTVPEGQYYLKSTIYLPRYITIKGINNQSGAVDLDGKARIHTFAHEVFKPKTGTEVIPNISYLMFQNRNGDPQTTLFSSMELSQAYIYRITTYAYRIVFFGKITNLSTVQKNRFQLIGQHFITSYVSSGLTNIFTDTDASIVDSIIEENYISGDPTQNITMFKLQGITNSKIIKNFMDFAKIAIECVNGTDSVIITNNTFDFCYRGIVGAITMVGITANSFNHISNAYLSYFPSPDTDMSTKEWICIEPSETGLNRATVSSNVVTNSQKFLKINGYNKYSLNVAGNTYDDPTITMVDYSVVLATWIPNDQKKVYIEDLMYKEYTTLPNPTITSDGTGGVMITSFNGQIIRNNNKLLFNHNGQWRDAMGTVISA
jgi:hypothetical protein